jgi:glutaredoxin 3
MDRTLLEEPSRDGGRPVRFSDFFGRAVAEDAQNVPVPDQTRELVLYASQTCGYCHRVQAHLDRLGLEVLTRDIHVEPPAREELIAKTGRGQVPCLFIDGQALFESADIMDWLSRYAEHAAQRP